MDWFGFPIFMIGYLQKGERGVRGTLKQGEQENSFWAIFIFKQAV
jgi:hypothetical protein